MKACLKPEDAGDGVTLFCARQFGHDGDCSPWDANGRRGNTGVLGACNTDGGAEGQCCRATGHDGPHKFRRIPTA